MAADLVGQTAPDFELEILGSEKKMLSDFTAKGKPVVIDFYANF